MQGATKKIKTRSRGRQVFGSSNGHDRCFLGNYGGGGEGGGVSGSSIWGAVDGSGTVEVTKIMVVSGGSSESRGGTGMVVMAVAVVEGTSDRLVSEGFPEKMIFE